MILDQIQYLVLLPQMGVDLVEEDLLRLQEILDLVDLVDLVVVEDTIQVVEVNLMLAVLLQIVTKDLLEELDINLDQNMVEVAVVVPEVPEVMRTELLLIQRLVGSVV